jgi:hypothetical protein
VVLRQIPAPAEIAGIALVVLALLLSAGDSANTQPETPP